MVDNEKIVKGSKNKTAGPFLGFGTMVKYFDNNTFSVHGTDLLGDRTEPPPPPDMYPPDTYPKDTYPSVTYPLDTYPLDTYPLGHLPLDTYPLDTSPLGTYPLGGGGVCPRTNLVVYHIPILTLSLLVDIVWKNSNRYFCSTL